MILFGEFFCEVGPQGFFEAPEHGCFQTTVIARMESVWERPRKARSSGEDWRQKAVVLFKGFEKARRGRLQHKAWKLVGHLILGFQRSLLDPSNTYNHIYIYIYIYTHIVLTLQGCSAFVSQQYEEGAMNGRPLIWEAPFVKDLQKNKCGETGNYTTGLPILPKKHVVGTVSGNPQMTNCPCQWIL